MKIAKKVLFTLSNFTLTIGMLNAPCIAMENSSPDTMQIQAATTRAIISHNENIFKNLQSDIEQSNFVFFDALVFTNKSLAEALKDAHDKGTHIEGTMGTHWCNKNMETFFDEHDIHIDKKSQNHLKRFGVSEKDPRLGSPGKCAIYEGSANPTNYSYHNFETVVQTKNDKPFFMQHFNDHTNIIRNTTHGSSEKKVLKLTPQKQNQAFGSDSNLLSESKVVRVQNLIKSKNKHRELYLTSMNWNSESMTQALIDAQRVGITIQVILNRSALEGQGKEQLARMHKKGVPIYIYDPGENNRTIQHSKVMVRIDGLEYLVINSTANMTPEGDKENNSDSYYPASQNLGKDICIALNKLIASDICKPYTEELAASAEHKKIEKQSAKKRVLFDKTNLSNHTVPDIDNIDLHSNKKAKK